MPEDLHGKAEVLSTHTAALFAVAVQRATGALQAGQVVALPTETVYGLAANAYDPTAVERIYTLKGRPRRNPIIVHVASLAMARECVQEWTETATRLAAAFWPGPLTLVLPRSDRIPDVVTAGGHTVGVRWPSHPLIQAVIRACGFPLAAPSANPSTGLSPTDAGHVFRTLGQDLPLIVDGGPAQVGIESTVVDLTQSPPRVLRPGMIHAESLVAVIGEVRVGDAGPEGTLRSPGQLDRHYSPRARLRVWGWRDETELVSRLRALGAKAESTHLVVHSRIPGNERMGRVVVIPHDAEAFARAIYAELHRCDEAGATLIVVEQPPDLPEWAGISDRLRRAAVGNRD